jgi:transcription initiation factor TFIIIB Brf1 subunit/transcription initiation factor TFIIB
MGPRKPLSHSTRGDETMGCKKGEKSKYEKKPGNYECAKCGVVVDKKGKVCKPKKIKKADK